MSLATALSDAAGRRWLACIDPRVKLLWLMTVSMLSVLLDATAALAALCACSACGTLGLRLPKRAWFTLAGLLLLIAWGTVLSQGLFYNQQPRTVLLTIVPSFTLADMNIEGLRLYREGTMYGLAQSLRMLSVTVAGLTVCLSTSPERLLAGLSRVGVPVALGFMTVTALRFLPLLLSELTIVRQARRLRGYCPRRLRSPRVTMASEVSLLRPVLAGALRRATALSASVTSRGFDPAARRTYFPELRLNWWEWCLVAVLVSTTTIITVAKLLYWFYLGDLYYHPGLRTLYAVTREFL